MKTKLKEPAELSSMANSAYMMKLKSDLSALKASPKEEGPNSFILRAEFQFSDEENTLFVAGINSAWKKHVKEEKWLKTPESKKTLVGTCQFNGDKIELTIIKGKLPKNLFTKAIKANRALKQYEWVIVKDAPETETEDDDDDDGLAVNGNEAGEQINEQDKQKAEDISKKLIVMLRSLSQLSDKTAKKELVLQIAKEAENLYAINNWEAYAPDKLETALAEIEQALNGYDAENVSPDDEDAEKAENICKEMIGLVQQIKGLEDKTKKAQLISQLSQLKTELEEIPNWKDYTPDNLEKVLGQLDEFEDKEEFETTIKELQETIIESFKKIKSAGGQDLKEINYFLRAVEELQSIPNWEKLTDDKIEAAIEQVQDLYSKKQQTEILSQIESIVDITPDDISLIENYKLQLSEFATVDQLDKFIADLEKDKTVSKAVGQFIKEKRQDVTKLREMEAYINENLDLSEEINKAIESASSDEEKLALSELLVDIEHNIKSILG